MKACWIAPCLFAVNTVFAYQKDTTFCAEDKDSSVVRKEQVIGNIKVAAEARNIDEVSQLRAECKSQQKKHKSEQNSSLSSEKKEEKKRNSTQVSLTFKLPAKD